MTDTASGRARNGDLKRGGTPEGVTDLLQAWSAGDREAGERLIGLVYDELRHQAARHLRRC